MRARTTNEAPPIDYPPEAILDIEHVAAWLRVGVRTAEKMGIPSVLIGPRTRRYRAGAVLEYMAKRESAA